MTGTRLLERHSTGIGTGSPKAWATGSPLDALAVVIIKARRLDCISVPVLPGRYMPYHRGWRAASLAGWLPVSGCLVLTLSQLLACLPSPSGYRWQSSAWTTPRHRKGWKGSQALLCSACAGICSLACWLAVASRQRTTTVRMYTCQKADRQTDRLRHVSGDTLPPGQWKGRQHRIMMGTGSVGCDGCRTLALALALAEGRSGFGSRGGVRNAVPRRGRA